MRRQVRRPLSVTSSSFTRRSTGEGMRTTSGIAAGIGVYFAGTFAGVFLPDLTQYLPFQLANTAIGVEGFGDVAAGLSPDTAILLLGAWLIGSLAVAAGFTQRAEITG